MAVTLLYTSNEHKKKLEQSWEKICEKMQGIHDLLEEINYCSGYTNDDLAELSSLAQMVEEEGVEFEFEEDIPEVRRNEMTLLFANQEERDEIKSDWETIRKEAIYLYKILQEFRMKYSLGMKDEEQMEFRYLEEFLEKTYELQLKFQPIF